VDTAVFENARAGSEHLRGDPGNPYRKLFFDLDEFTQKSLRKALTPEDVAKVIVRAATARRPKARYITPFSARAQLACLGLLPERWVDRLLRRVYKLDAGRVP
jgi:short-subunit dehydrogenase